MHWWFQDGLAGWIGFLFALMVGLAIGITAMIARRVKPRKPR
jgi:hypothetical protein